MRDRVIERKRVRGADLKPHPLQWREHGEVQRRHVAAMLEQVGQLDDVFVIERNGDLLLLDGHLRSEIADDQEVRVAVTDLDDDEARRYLLGKDTLTGLAGVRLDVKLQLIEQVGVTRLEGTGVEPIDIEGMLNDLQGPKPPTDFPEYDENIDLSNVPTATCPECGHEFPV